jgi:hypothetical protein
VAGGFDTGQPGVGKGGAVLAQGAAGTGGKVEGLGAAAGLGLELGQRSELVGGEQPVARDLAALTLAP